MLSCSGVPFDCSLPIQMARVKQPSIEEPFGSKGPTAKEEALAREREERFSKLSAWKVRKLMDVDVYSDSWRGNKVWLFPQRIHLAVMVMANC